MRILVIVVFLFFSLALKAQRFYHVGVEEGLSSHQAYDVVQDKNGFIWIATKVGIDRFDGDNIVNFEYPGDDGEITFQRLKLRTDQMKNLWAYTSQGEVFSFDEGNNSFKRIFSVRDSIPINSLNNLTIDKNIWFCTDNGLWKFNQNEKELEEITFLRGKRVSLVYPYSGDGYFITASGEMFDYNAKTGVFKSLLTIQPDGKFEGTQSQSVYWNELLDEIWIGTNSGDVIIYNRNSESIINLKDKIKELPEVPIFKIVSTSNNEIFLGSDGGGVFKFDAQKKTLIHNYREDEDSPNSLEGNGVQDLFLSSSGNLYISTYTGGVNILNSASSTFNIIRHETNNPNSLRNNVVNNILEDLDGDLWFATNNGVSCWIKQEDKWIHFEDNPKLMSNTFLSLCQYDRNTVMAGSYGKGIYFLSKKEGVKRQLFIGKKDDSIKKTADYIVDIHIDNKKRIWTGDTFKEMAVFDPNKNAVRYIPLVGVKSIQPKDENHIFAGTSDGVYIVNTESLKLQKVELDTVFSNGIFVNSLNFDPMEQELWIATSGLGLLRHNFKTQETEILNKEKGLPSNHVYAVLRFNENTIWVSSEKGLVSINENNDEIEIYSTKDGLSDESFYKNSKLKSRSGEFYFGSYQGVTFFNPGMVEYQNEKAILFLEELLINNKKYFADEKRSPLNKSLNQTQSLKLRYNQSSFSIGFSVITPVNSGEVEFSWKLEGQDDVWSLPSNNKRANYTNVPYGNFQFKLRALSKRTGQVIDERSVDIVVKPAPWETAWAKILISLVVLSIFVFVFMYLRVFDKKKLSDAKIQFFTNTAHDIKTPLTLAMAPLGDLQKSKNLNEKDRYLLDLSYSNISNLSNSVNHLLDFQKSDMGKNQLVLSKVDVIKLVKERIAYFSQIAEKKNIKFKVRIEPDNLIEWIDLAKIEKVLDNLLSNAFKYTSNEGEILLHLSADGSTWQVSVKDNGIGIPQEAQKSLFKRYYRGENAINSKITGTGIGLLLARNYVLLHKGKITYNSKEGQGSTFVISFNSGRDHYEDSAKVEDISTEKKTKEIIRTKEYQREESGNKRRQKLLLVEDNDKLRKYLANTLSEFYQTFEAEDGEMALTALRKDIPDIIVSDIGMPNLDGIELTKQLKENFETSHIPIILLTAFDENKDVIKGLRSGADDYITKPFDSSILLARIENVLRNRQKIKNRFLGYSETKIEKDTFSDKKDQEFIEKAIAFIEKNITEPDLTKEKFAQEMFVSESLLYKKLKALTGQSPSDFIKTIRLKKAMDIIKQGKKSISEVANITGFSDAKYFSTSFKKFYGKPPSAFS